MHAGWLAQRIVRREGVMPAALKAVDLANLAGQLQRVSRALGGDESHPEEWRRDTTVQINKLVVMLLNRQSESVTASMAAGAGKPPAATKKRGR